MNKPLIIDVGANYGDFSIPAAKANPESLILAIEPLDDCLSKMQVLIDENHLSNISIQKKCIAETEGTVALNFYNTGDNGLSSVMDLKQPESITNDYWRSRSDVMVSKGDKVIVDSVPLSTILSEYSFSTIAFIKIDVQGKDLEVLKSSGEFVDKIEAGMLEVSATNETTLYDNEPVLLDALSTLEELNFKVVYIKSNDPACNEFNVFFAQKNIHWQQHLEQYGLHDNPIVSGKNYWHYPSSSLDFSLPIDDQKNTEIIDKTFIEEPNFLLKEEEVNNKTSVLETIDRNSMLYFDLTDLINHVRFSPNVNGIQRVVFEFAKYINDTKSAVFFYLNPINHQAYYLKDFDLKNASDLSCFRHFWFLGMNQWKHEDYLNLFKQRLDQLSGLKAKILRKILPFLSFPILKNIFVKLSKYYLKYRFPQPKNIKFYPIDHFKKDDIVAIFGGVWNFQLSYDRFFDRHKEQATFVTYLHDMIPLIKENLVPIHLNTVFKPYLTYLLKCSHVIVTSSSNNITDLSTVSERYHPDLSVPSIVAVGLFYGFNQIERLGSIQQSELRPDVRSTLEQTFVLNVGSIEPRKNHIILLQAWRKFISSDAYNGELLVLAGGWGVEIDSIKEMLTFSGYLNGSVVLIEKPSDVELLALYHASKFTVYPSHYEGWGLPISESMYLSKPVIHFRNSCLTEVSFGAAYVVEDLQGLLQGFKDLFGNEEIYSFYCNRLNSIKELLPNWSHLSERILREIYAHIER